MLEELLEEFLQAIDDVFTPALKAYQFVAADLRRYGEYVQAKYVNGERPIIVGYAANREQRCEVDLTGYGNPEPTLKNIMGSSRTIGRKMT